MINYRGRVVLWLTIVATSGLCYSQQSGSSENPARRQGAYFSSGSNAETKQIGETASLQHLAASGSQPSEKLELLVRKFSSVSDLGSSGTMQLVWLSPELLDAMVSEYGSNVQMTPAAINLLKKNVQDKLDWGRSLAFLIIFKPKEGSFISQPDWVSDGKDSFPSLVLRGTGNRLAAPRKWSQILGEGEHFWYSRSTSGYLIYRARDSDGRPYLDPRDFSFSVIARTTAEPSNGNLYDVRAEFHYDSMPVQLQQMVDASLPAGNNSLVTMTEVPKEASVSDQESASRGRPAAYAFESNSASLTRPEILQIIGLGIAFTQLAVAVF